MTSANVHDLQQPDPDKAFAAEEARKSDLLVEAQMLRARQQPDGAAVKFAQAAEFEERLAGSCFTKGLRAEGWVHRFSAAGCWAQAGNFHEAITLGDELLTEPEFPGKLRERVQAYTATLRRRREQWSAGLSLATTGSE